MAIKPRKRSGWTWPALISCAPRGPLVMEVSDFSWAGRIETTTGVDIAGKMIAWIERQATPGFCLKMGG